MQKLRISVLLGAVLGLIPIALGVVALVTRKWSYYSPDYNLFTLNTGTLHPQCNKLQMKQLFQGLEIGGVAAIAVGVIVSVLLNIIVKNRWIRRAPLILLILGSTAIFIGLILLLECTKNHGFSIGLVPIILGITGLTTSNWISINHNGSSAGITYGLFQKFPNETIQREDLTAFEICQYFEISGYVLLILGVFIGILCTELFYKRNIQFISPIIIMIGTILIFIGLLLYIKTLVEMTYDNPIENIYFGYSMILMICTNITGCILTVYFSFVAGYIHRHILSTVNIY
ncbi:unnamed protein product [Adineta steineri]|uniref:Uncharacterized protein n=1 Tax=Adineta steineri TaxID=433720 RepID=A0A819J6B2_9BILA|nr:unnamed protein product [Adineta steineri]CAF3923866.1 unnamed protein product [Adineta steineri]